MALAGPRKAPTKQLVLRLYSYPVTSCDFLDLPVLGSSARSAIRVAVPHYRFWRSILAVLAAVLTLTLDLYSHVTTTMQEEPAAKLDTSFRGARRGWRRGWRAIIVWNDQWRMGWDSNPR
jgi:hypothetical protein